MITEQIFELHRADGTTFHAVLRDTFRFEDKEYALLTAQDNDSEVAIMHIEVCGEQSQVSSIDDEEEWMRVQGFIQHLLAGEMSETELYVMLENDAFNDDSYEVNDLGEGMAVVNESMWGWWKPRYLVNHNSRCAYEFIDENQRLVTIQEDDIDWASLEGLPEKAIDTARTLSFRFPSFIYGFKNGVAQVSWQINPDGRYYMDEDGFGMTSDYEIEIYGFIDKEARAVVKFRNINESQTELARMRKEAEALVKAT